MTVDATPRPPITGDDLKDWGHRPSKQFPALLARANALRAQGFGAAYIRNMLQAEIPPLPEKLALRAPNTLKFHENIVVETEDEQRNLDAVRATMTALMRTPTLTAGAILPDACPAGPLGTIPVGAVAVARNALHPGMHSADICCSVMLSDLGEAEPKALLDAAQRVTHFGAGGRGRARAGGAYEDRSRAARGL